MPQGRRRHKKESAGFKPWQKQRPDKAAEAEAANAVEHEVIPNLYARPVVRRSAPSPVSLAGEVNVSRLAIEATLIERRERVPSRPGAYVPKVSFNRRRKHKGSPRHVARMFDETRPKRQRSQSLAQELASFNRWLAANGIRKDMRQRMLLDRAARAIIKNPKRSVSNVDWSGRIRSSEVPAFELRPDMDGSGKDLSRRERVEIALGGPHISEILSLNELAYSQWLGRRDDDDAENETCAQCGELVRIETTMSGGVRVCCVRCGEYEVGSPPLFVAGHAIVRGLACRRRFFAPGTRAVQIRERHPIAAVALVRPAIDVLRVRPRASRAIGKWASVIEQACGGQPFAVPIPADQEPRQFATKINSILRGNKRTMLVRWSARLSVDRRLVKIAPIGVWADAVEIHAAKARVG